MRIVGITGTNARHLCLPARASLDALKSDAAYIGTVGGAASARAASTHTNRTW